MPSARNTESEARRPSRAEEGTLARIKQLRREVVEPKVREHHGRVFKTTGDGLLVEFASPVEAVRCAAAVQEVLESQVSQEPSGGLGTSGIRGRDKAECNSTHLWCKVSLYRQL
jgi:class 3 adenylate cyclase